MKKLLCCFCISVMVLTAVSQSGAPSKTIIHSPVKAIRFDVVTAATKVTIVYAHDESRLDSVAAHLLAADIQQVTGYLPEVVTDIAEANGNVIAIGSLQSSLIKSLAGNAFAPLAGKWECYGYRVVHQPAANIWQALVIAGSDARGTAYGVFSISGKIGVSPWYWWADVIPDKKKTLSLLISDYTSAPPSVKYRGIFINDEDWGLQPWAAKTFEPETGDIGPRTYAKVFELLLRLKANFIWPAMHPSTRAFFHYPGNVKMADLYEIVIGSSHAEPMLRNNVGEWDEKTMGHFNYLTNKEKVHRYWEDRVKASSGINAIYSLGMRGVHDSPIEGPATAKEAVPLVEQVFSDQRGLLRQYIDSDVTKVPQVFTPYKEVLDIYADGLKVPDDVTLMWPDDNYGYIQRLSNEEEAGRRGGSGVYYHASYWGRPHDYLWLGTTHPALIREEMMKAYAMNAKQIWVLNVGDIKPAEYNLQLFMDMAYRADAFYNPAYPRRHLQQWAAATFGRATAASIADVLWKYYGLAWERKPEYMGWSQTEPTTKTGLTAYNHFYFGDEAQQRINQYSALEATVESIRKSLPPNRKDAWYQLVQYPVVGAALMNKKFLYHDKARYYAQQARMSAPVYDSLSRQAYEKIGQATDTYNTRIAGGKWNAIMDSKPRRLPVFDIKTDSTIPAPANETWRVVAEGDAVFSDAANGVAALPAFRYKSSQQYFLDVFLTAEPALHFTVLPSAGWIKLSTQNGYLSPAGLGSQQRIWVSIDWAKAPAKPVLTGSIVVKGAGKQYTIRVKANATEPAALKGFKGFVENNGYVSIQASHFSRQANTGNGDWKRLPGLSYTGLALEAGPVSAKDSLNRKDTAWIRKNGSSVAYDFYTFSAGKAALTIFSVPTHPLNTAYSMRYAVAVDDGPLQVIDFHTVGRSEEWKQNVLRNRAEKKISIPFLGKGKHQLRIYSIDPGTVLDAVLIDLGGLKKAYSSIPETR